MKRKENREVAGSGFWNRLQESVQQEQLRMAEWLGRGFGRCSRGVQKMTLVFFTLLCSGICSWVFSESIFGRKNKMAPIDSIHQPATYLSKKRLPVLSYQEYLRLHAYRLHLDSLLKSGDMGQRQTRDTILFLEGIYLQQFKK